MSTTTTTADILHQTTTFLSKTLAEPDFRRHISATLRSKLPPSSHLHIHQLNLAFETLETAITTTTASAIRSSSLRLSENLLLSFPHNPFSCFLLSLIYTLFHRHIDASISFLTVFEIDPYITRTEISPQVFEELFLINFVPVLEWYNNQRSRILSSLNSSNGYESDENSVVMDSGVSCMDLLSKINGNQALELKELERDYEHVLDENCRVFVAYFKEVLGNKAIKIPSVVIEMVRKGDEYEFKRDEKSLSAEFGSKNGRYNPIWTDEGEYEINRSKTLSKFPSFFPERVSPSVLTNHKPSLRSSKPSPNYKDSESEPDDNSSSMSPSDSDAELEEKTSFDKKQTQSQKQKQPILVESRRIFNNQILHIIKDEGTFSSMHTLLIYLQTAAADQMPIVAGLLLQLDLLAEPRKMSIYREEAIDTLISCLKNPDSPAAQIAAAETVLALQGRFSFSGKPIVRTYLLKHAGLDKSYRSMIRKEQLATGSRENQETKEEEQLAEEWEKKTAFVLVSHDFGLIFEALSEGLKSKYAEICSACFLSATWLVHMLTVLPDMGIQGAARICLLNRFVSIFRSANDIEDKAISMLALSCFINDPDGLRDIRTYMKDILKGLREFKKSSTVAIEMLKVLSEGSESSADLWNHKELTKQDCTTNGEVLSIVCLKDKIFSGHSDGTIKVWTGKGSVLHLIQEIREHSKAVTSLTVLQSGDTLYSGSLDKTVRGWSIKKEMIQCEQVYDVKDHVNNLLVANSISCFIPQGAGIKIHAWSGTSKLLNASKYVKCLALVQGRLYSGCQDNSIQEIDLATGTLSSIQSGSRKLLSKSNPVHALIVHDGLIYSASSSVEGTAIKIWNASNYALIHSVSLASEVRTMVISSDMIYMGCKGGIVEVWCKKKLTRKEILQIGTNCRILSMALDSNEDVLVVGTSDGWVQAWGVS